MRNRLPKFSGMIFGFFEFDLLEFCIYEFEFDVGELIVIEVSVEIKCLCIREKY